MGFGFWKSWATPILRAGSTVYKYYLHLTIWSLRVCMVFRAHRGNGAVSLKSAIQCVCEEPELLKSSVIPKVPCQSCQVKSVPYEFPYGLSFIESFL